MKRSLAYLALVAAAVVALDRWTKHWATAELALRPPLRLFGDYVRLNYARNSGVAFGIGHGTGFPYYVFSLVAIAAILSDLGILPASVIVLKNGKLVPEDVTASGDDQVRIIRIAHGG